MALSNQAFLKNLLPSENWNTFITEVASIASGVVPEGSISAAELATTLDLSGKTLTLGAFTLAGKITATAAGLSRAIDIQNTPTSADRMIYLVVDYGANTKEAVYVTAKSAATSGEVIGIRGRAENEAASASTAEARGLYGQGIATAALDAGTVTGVQAEAIAKGTSTVVTVRGGFFGADSEDTPTSITNMYGTHTRVKTSVAPGTDFIGSLIETEKFGSGVALDSFLSLKTTTWTGGETVATDVITTASLTGTVTNIFNYSTVVATSFLYSDATITNFLETSADSKGGAGATRTSPNQTATCDGSIVVKIGSKTLLLPLYNAVTIA